MIGSVRYFKQERETQRNAKACIGTIATLSYVALDQRTAMPRLVPRGMKKATFVRQLIREEPFVTAADVVKDAAVRMGDARLRISRVRVSRVRAPNK
jgi:hypothetical protein